MLIKDLICNDDFDVNCNYAIYDCRNTDKTWDESECLYNSLYHTDDNTIADWILNLNIGYLTIDIHRKCLIIETK